MRTKTNGEPIPELQGVSGDGGTAIAEEADYRVELTLRGTCPILFHRYSVESVEDKKNKAKNSKSKKTDDVESYVYRDEKGNLGIPTLNLCRAMALAAKSVADPRSPRKSAHDLFTAGVIPDEELALLLPKAKVWDFLDQRRVKVQMAAVARIRPGMHQGWTAVFRLTVAVPQYITRELLLKVAGDAGRLCGLCDYRPVYGRFQVVEFKIL